MTQIIDGKILANGLVSDIKEEISNINPKPSLAVVLVGKNPASEIYVNNKEKVCKKCGIKSIIYRLNNDAKYTDLVDLIEDLNHRQEINGILVQLPLPRHLNEQDILNKIAPEKDVDGFCATNAGKLFLANNLDTGIIPCTADGCMILLDSLNIDLNGKKAVVIGRSNIVGKPLAHLLLNRNCTVSILHSKTKEVDFLYETRSADILIVAIGQAKFIKKHMVKENSIIIDVGINRLENKICGDVDFDDVASKCSYITPVPGGVGPMTVACLMKNTLRCYLMQNNRL